MSRLLQKWSLCSKYNRLLSTRLTYPDLPDEFKSLFIEEKKYSLEEMPYKHPFHIFKLWFQEAKESQDIVNPNIVCLATATPSGKPSLRYMLCDAFDEGGFRFFTHHTTRKGTELKMNPVAAMCFFWAPFLRTVRIEGRVEQLPDTLSDELFASRSYESQINMHCSTQTERIPTCEVLKDKKKELMRTLDSSAVPRPAKLGWYLLTPTTVEFWQLKQKKERMRFRRPLPNEKLDELTHKGSDGWLYEYLEP